MSADSFDLGMRIGTILQEAIDGGISIADVIGTAIWRSGGQRETAGEIAVGAIQRACAIGEGYGAVSAILALCGNREQRPRTRVYRARNEYEAARTAEATWEIRHCPECTPDTEEGAEHWTHAWLWVAAAAADAVGEDLSADSIREMTWALGWGVDIHELIRTASRRVENAAVRKKNGAVYRRIWAFVERQLRWLRDVRDSYSVGLEWVVTMTDYGPSAPHLVRRCDLKAVNG